MKVNGILALVLTAALLLCGCAQRGIPLTAEGLEQPVPTATPEPQGMRRVFGKEVTVAVWGTDASANAARETLDALGIPYVDVEDAQAANACDAAIITVDDSFGMGDTKVPAVVCTNNPYMERENGCVVYCESDVAAKALDVMFLYPSHEAPIRILGLFSSKESPAALAFEAMRGEGKLYVKGEYYGDEAETDAESWTAQALSGVAVGQLDTIFTEDPALAMAAYNALRAAQRNDAVEVITAGYTEEIVNAMREDHFSMGAYTADNTALAGRIAAYMAVRLLAGEAVERVQVEPETGYSSALDEMGAQEEALAEAYRTDTVNYLLDYNK